MPVAPAPMMLHPSTVLRMELKKESVKEILKHFFLEKLSKTNKNVESWCSLFEKECSRFSGMTERKKIEVFKSCLEPNMEDWFVLNHRVLPAEAKWSDWKATLLTTFGDNSWVTISYAFNY